MPEMYLLGDVPMMSAHLPFASVARVVQESETQARVRPDPESGYLAPCADGQNGSVIAHIALDSAMFPPCAIPVLRDGARCGELF